MKLDAFEGVENAGKPLFTAGMLSSLLRPHLLHLSTVFAGQKVGIKQICDPCVRNVQKGAGAGEGIRTLDPNLGNLK